MMEKNALLFMVLFLSVLNVGGAVNIYIPTGANYTFLSTITETIEAIQWTHDYNIMVEWDSPNPKPQWYRYRDRGQLNIKTGDLTLRMVEKADSGVFRGQFQVKGILRYAEYTVTVIVQATFVWSGPNGFFHTGDSFQISSTESDLIYYCTVSKATTEFKLKDCQDAVSEPNVTAEQKDTDITLLCSMETSVQAEFTCTGPNLRSHDGKSVYVTRGKSDDSIYYCTAKKIN